MWFKIIGHISGLLCQSKAAESSFAQSSDWILWFLNIWSKRWCYHYVTYTGDELRNTLCAQVCIQSTCQRIYVKLLHLSWFRILLVGNKVTHSEAFSVLIQDFLDLWLFLYSLKLTFDISQIEGKILDIPAGPQPPNPEAKCPIYRWNLQHKYNYTVNIRSLIMSKWCEPNCISCF